MDLGREILDLDGFIEDVFVECQDAPDEKSIARDSFTTPEWLKISIGHGENDRTPAITQLMSQRHGLFAIDCHFPYGQVSSVVIEKTQLGRSRIKPRAFPLPIHDAECPIILETDLRNSRQQYAGRDVRDSIDDDRPGSLFGFGLERLRSR